MAYLGLGKDDDGNVIWLAVTDTGNTTKTGKPIYKLDIEPQPPASIGVSGAAMSSPNASGAPVAVTDAPAAKLVLTNLVVSVGSALTVTFTEETTGKVVFVQYMAANSTVNIALLGKLKLSTATKRLMVQTSGAGNITVTATWYSEA